MSKIWQVLGCNEAPKGEHMTERERHVPVLLKEAIRYLNVRPGGTYCDATLGLAGHSTAIARQLGPRGKLIAFDRDPEAMCHGAREAR